LGEVVGHEGILSAATLARPLIRLRHLLPASQGEGWP
jgi:hypothetical protein